MYEMLKSSNLPSVVQKRANLCDPVHNDRGFFALGDPQTFSVELVGTAAETRRACPLPEFAAALAVFEHGRWREAGCHFYEVLASDPSDWPDAPLPDALPALPDRRAAAIAVVIAALSNTVVKCGMATALGGPALRRPMLLTTVGVIVAGIGGGGAAMWLRQSS